MGSDLLLTGIACALAAAVAGATLPFRLRMSVVAALTMTASISTGAAGLHVLLSDHPIAIRSSEVIPVTGISIRLDSLGALFVVVTAAIAFASSLYSIGYSAHGSASRTSSSTLPIFVIALVVVPCADSVGTFLFFWELMAISSLILVFTGHRDRAEVRSAGHWYGVMTQLGAAAILAAFVLLAAHSGGQSFEAIRSHAPKMSATLRGLAFVLALIGFSSKAGAVPMHVWLPRAHPEAPSPVSALMSAAMVNLGIYGIVRVGYGLLGGGPSWWWISVLIIGALSALFGALHSATGTDLKRLLAYSTTDNIGLILMGVGASGILASERHPALSAIALVAALLHVVCHAAFKGSLFLSAGSVQTATGTRDLDLLGGLMKRVPITATIFAVGALSISALPPLCGFVSEWLLLQSFLHGLASSTTTSSIVLPIAVGIFALTGGLTAAAFVKAVGIGVLGQPRTAGAIEAKEVPWSMQTGAGLLAFGCVAIGVAPFTVIPRIVDAAMSVLPAGPRAVSVTGWSVGLVGFKGAFSPALIALLLVGCVGTIVLVRRRLHISTLRRTEAWGCGRELQTARMEYTATSFAEPLQRVFDNVLRPDLDLDVSHAAESRYFVHSIKVHNQVDDAVERHAYRPMFASVQWWGDKARRLQNGSVHRYLTYGLIAVILVLVFVS